MTQAQEEAAKAKPSLLARVFGSRIVQAIGIVGFAIAVFEKLEPFFKLSRFMSYLVYHWREWTRGLWSWLASWFNLDLPTWSLDLATLATLVLIFTARGLTSGVDNSIYQAKSVSFKVFEAFIKWIFDGMPTTLGDKYVGIARTLADTLVSLFLLALLFVGIIIFAFVAFGIVPFVIFLILYVHIGIGPAYWASILFLPIYFLILVAALGFRDQRRAGIFYTSERAMLVLVALLALNYVGLHSHAIEAVIERATQ